MKSARISIGGLGNKYHTPLYILITITLFTIASITVLSIRFALTGAVGNEGNAILTNVAIKQAGTGQSVTIKGETLDEITLNQEAGYGTDDASRRIILNNNVVRYDATYNVTSPGIIELSITLPANNTIDEATIGSAQQCMNGSKLESADITNSDGTVTKSYTNNKATCIRNITNVATGSTLQTNWQITAYPWGSNNEQITPTLAINNQAQDTKPEPITVIGKPNYDVKIFVSDYNDASNGVDRSVAIAGHIESPESSTNVLGVSPLDLGEYTVSIDMANMPKGWSVNRSDGYDFNSNCDYKYCTAMSGHREIKSDLAKNVLHIKIKDIAMAVRKWPLVDIDGTGETMYVWSAFRLYFDIPVSSLTDDSRSYEMRIADSHGTASGKRVDILPSRQTMSWTLSSAGSALIQPYVTKSTYSGSGPTGGHALPGWPNAWISGSAPMYVGQETLIGFNYSSNSVPTDDKASNVYMCQTWNPSKVQVREFVQSVEFTYGDAGDVEYGVISEDLDSVPKVSMCGRFGDDKSGVSFFSDLDDAKTYALSINASVNAMRMYIPELATGKDVKYGYGEFVPVSIATTGQVFSFGATSDNWAAGRQDRSYALTPGLLSHALTAEPSSTNPGKEDHITITTKTYNKDTNAKITVNLPAGLSIKPGTITIKDPNTGNPIPLIEGETSDYTVSLNTTNATATTTTTPTSNTTSDDTNLTNTAKLTNGSTITFNLDNIATNHGINLTGYEPIYPGESGVTSIECNTASNTTSSTTSNTTNSSDTNPTCHEVITTNNNNTDDDPINDDLPIAADNNGNGIEHTHTPIEFDVVIDEDTPAPSTLTINSTASGTGTDYASSTFKSASDTIAVADPPRTFGYDLTTSSNYVYAGDNLTYNYQVSNLTNNEVTNLDLVTVLPYNDDSRGTTGLIDPATPATNPYTLTNLTTSLPDGAHLYCTIDTTAVRQIEQGKDTSALISDPSIIWQELDSNTIPTDIASKITALRLSIASFAMDSKANFSITLTNILANNPTTDLQPSLASDITYLGYQAAGIPTLTSHTNLVKTSYEGNLLVLNPDKTTITTNLNPNEAKLGNGNVDNPDSLTNRLDITARTLNGYTVTMQVKGSSNSLLPISTNNASNTNNTNDTNDNTNRLIPAINTTPTAGLTGWAISLDATNANPTWQAVPAINPDADQLTLPLSIYQTDGNGPKSLRLPIAYGVSTGQNTIADTYRAEVVYTLTAGL